MEPLDAVDCKCDPHYHRVAEKQPGFFSDYHMSESSWITVALDGSVLDGRIKMLWI